MKSGLDWPARLLGFAWVAVIAGADLSAQVETLNQRADGYRGIWYYNQKLDNEYVYKYSGGLGTYCAKHRPFSVYCEEVEKTFFCYGGTSPERHDQLLHMVSYFDHRTGQVPRPTILLDKQTSDAHDNPVISVDAQGFVWIFSTSHGRSRPSFVHRSVLPYQVDEFERVTATYVNDDDEEAPLDNFSYMQVWRVDGRPRNGDALDEGGAGEAVEGGALVPEQAPVGGGRSAELSSAGGFVAFFTRYRDPAARTNMFMTSSDGVRWSRWQRLAAIEQGHYQISAARDGKAATAFNYHPDGKGLNWRTNLYYLETGDLGASWQTADGTAVQIPVTEVDSPTLIRGACQPGQLVYLKDIDIDAAGHPVILYLTSAGYASGPQNAPRTWRIARWTGEEWSFHDITTSDNNYDMGSIYVAEGAWSLIGPTNAGPQPFNPGGEITLWNSRDQGATWDLDRVLTRDSPRNHTYARRPVPRHPQFFAFWADGHGRRSSESRLYFSDDHGRVFLLPPKMEGDFARPMEQPAGE